MTANLERRSYTQGMTQDRKDELDGERDALRVLAGKDPIRRLDAPVTAGYRRGWEAAVEAAQNLATAIAS